MKVQSEESPTESRSALIPSMHRGVQEEFARLLDFSLLPLFRVWGNLQAYRGLCYLVRGV